MFVRDYISKDFPAFDIKNSAKDAYEVSKEFGYSHIFIKKNGIFVGALSQICLEENSEDNLESLEVHFDRFAILEDGNVLDTIKLFYAFNSNIIPVINNYEEYLGYISCEDIFNEFSKYPLFSENGAILTVQTRDIHYSFSEISKIVESNNAKIYGCYVSNIKEDSVFITLKISGQHLSSIDETFERFGYTIVQKYYNDGKEELIKERFGFFQKYLEI